MKSPGGPFSSGFAQFLGSVFNVRLPGGRESDRKGSRYDYDYEGLAQEPLNGGGHHMQKNQQQQQIGRGFFNGSVKKVVSERKSVKK